MASIDIRQFLNNFNSYSQQTFTARGTFNATNQVQTQTLASTTSQAQTVASEIAQNTAQTTATSTTQNLQLNTLQNMDRAIYAKEVLSFPRNMNEFIFMLQRGMTQAQFNQLYANQLAAQRNTLSQLQAQILAQLQGLNTTAMKEMVNIQLASQSQSSLKSLQILAGGMINLEQISTLLQQNGKIALTKLIMSMTEMSKSGISDLSQIKEMAKLINACISVAAENNPQKTLKLLLMLYLPWLPLDDGVGFDLEVQSEQNEKEENDSILVITITTINYGNIKATLILDSSNSVQVSIDCSSEFPKTELSLRLNKEQKFYSMDSVINYNSEKSTQKFENQPQKTSVNMSNTTEINPYLLLMAHAIIKNVIEIDNNKTLGISSHID
jgi:hypothetical protein